LDDVLRAINIYKSVLYASRYDGADINNTFGFVTTLNEVSKKVGKATNFAEFDTKYADLVLNDLNTIASQLEWYKAVFLTNRGNKIYGQDRCSANTAGILFNKVREFINQGDTNIKEWKGYSVIAQLLNNNQLPTLNTVATTHTLNLT
jgi:hypothetical protein